MRAERSAAAVAAALVLADASIVTLALPPILVELDTTVEGVAAVIGAYTLALALSSWIASRLGAGGRALWVVSVVAFAATSVGCGLAGSLGVLVTLRAAQGLAGGALLAAAFSLLAGQGRRLWAVAAVTGAAVGPALGGALTDVFEWRAIFLVQGPVVLAAGLLGLRAGELEPVEPVELTERGHAGPAVAFALLAAALTGVLFLLVLLLVSGWALSPLEAALVVSVLPAAALLGALGGGSDRSRAVAGCLLVAAGVTALGFLAGDSVLYVLPAQAVAGAGMGMALPALAGGLLPERSVRDAGRLLTVRHLGITAALVALAPIMAERLETAADTAKLRGTAVLLDAELSPGDKLELVSFTTADFDTVAPREELRGALREGREQIDPERRPQYASLGVRLDSVLLRAINEAFRLAFLICGGLAALAALVLAATAGRVPSPLVAAAAGLAVLFVVGQAAIAADSRPAAVTIADPCDAERDVPDSGGLGGLLQKSALAALDQLACDHGSTREELALALADDAEAERYERRYDVDLGFVRGLVEDFAG